jgi:hypothetical protein
MHITNQDTSGIARMMWMAVSAAVQPLALRMSETTSGPVGSNIDDIQFGDSLGQEQDKDTISERLRSLSISIATSEIVNGSPLELSFAALSRGETSTAPSSPIGAAALAIDANGVFRSARQRLNATFWLNVWICISMAVILMFALSGSIISGFIYRSPMLSVIFGSITLADLLGAYFWRPLKIMWAALLNTTRLDLLLLRYNGQIKECESKRKLVDRVICCNEIWAGIVAELNTLQNN